jgi:hypothetical protein
MSVKHKQYNMLIVAQLTEDQIMRVMKHMFRV